eukprot:2330584-Alexandrium_andersonii.AAC.1
MSASPVLAAALENSPTRATERKPPRMSWACSAKAPSRCRPRGLPRGSMSARLASGVTTSASRLGRGVHGTVERSNSLRPNFRKSTLPRG